MILKKFTIQLNMLPNCNFNVSFPCFSLNSLLAYKAVDGMMKSSVVKLCVCSSSNILFSLLSLLPIIGNFKITEIANNLPTSRHAYSSMD